MDLQVCIRNIGEGESHQFHGMIPFEMMDELLIAIGKQPHGVRYRLQMSRRGQYFFVTGEVEGELILSCDRCVEPFRFFQKEPFEMTLFPAESEKELKGDMMLSDEELEMGIYQGEYVDLQKIVEEQILLGLPMKRICSENCQGICAQCGNNLNNHPCVCPPPENSDHPFSCLVQ